MNKRQKKKLLKQTLIRVKKIHPNKGDVILLQPNLNLLDLNTAVGIVNFSQNKKIFGEATVVILPMDIKKVHDKEEFQSYINKLQNIAEKWMNEQSQ